MRAVIDKITSNEDHWNKQEANPRENSYRRKYGDPIFGALFDSVDNDIG